MSVQLEPQVVSAQMQLPLEQVLPPPHVLPATQLPAVQVRGTLFMQSAIGSAQAAHRPRKHTGLSPLHVWYVIQSPFKQSCASVDGVPAAH